MSNLYNTYSPYAEMLYGAFDEITTEEVPETDYVMNQVLHVENLDRPEFVSHELIGLPQPTQRKVLEDLAAVKFDVGDPIRRRPSGYGFRTAWPVELTMDLERAAGFMDADMASKVASFGEFMRQGRRNAFWKADAESALLFTNATSTAARYLTRDGQPLAGTHTAAGANPAFSQVNYDTNLPLTEANVFSFIQDIRTQKSQSGAWRKRPSKFTLLVSPTDERAAWQLLYTPEEVGTNNNTKNAVAEMRKKGEIDIVVWNELPDGFWAVLADTHELMFFWYEKPKFNKEEHGRNRSVEYQMNARWVPAFAKNWYGTAFSMPV